LWLCIGTAFSLGACPAAFAGLVTNCNDSGAGSFREQLSSALNGSTVDLSTLQCSRITLTSGEVATSAQSVDIRGSATHRVVIDAGSHSRLIHHTGFSNLDIEYLTLTNGKYSVTGNAAGGCVASSGKVNLTGDLLSNCQVASTGSGNAKGGALYASSGAVLYSTTIADSLAVSDNADARGGGVYSGFNLRTMSVTLSGNQAVGVTSFGGGAFSLGDAFLKQTTVSGNSADIGGGLVLHFGPQASPSVVVSQNTISGNSATTSVGGLFARAPLVLQNSTVTNNTESVQNGAGVYLQGASQLDSTIVAGNKVGSTPCDLGGGSSPSASGSHNIIGISLFPGIPADSVSTDPLLKPLADNGGVTRTHALNAGSPAINHGHMVGTLPWDQRDVGFPRVVGGTPDIGAFESGSDIIFANGFN
jgi:hypothetical protein